MSISFCVGTGTWELGHGNWGVFLVYWASYCFTLGTFTGKIRMLTFIKVNCKRSVLNDVS